MQSELLKTHIKAGHSTRVIVKLENKSPTTINYWLNKHGLKTKPHYHTRHNPTWEPNKLQKIISESISVSEVLKNLE